MKNNNVFEIRNLVVSYRRGDHAAGHEKRALVVPKLDIPRGKIIFVLGNSGSGKTTLLETLGLMSAYADPKSQIVYYPEENGSGIHYSHVWGNDAMESQIRRCHFTFMFQDTYLFPQLTMKENVALTQIIRSVEPEGAFEDSIQKLRLLEIDHLSENRIMEMSGGERQRTSFARAVLAGGTILFADEPTGNLGDEDAAKVMREISDLVNKSEGGCTAIIVTHNIRTALEYGELIIVIQEDHYVREENVLTKSKGPRGDVWKQLSSTSYRKRPERAVGLLKERLHGSGSHVNEIEDRIVETPASLVQTDKYDSSHFARYFGPRSEVDLSVKKWNSWMLVAVLTFAFLTIGFSAGSLEVLRFKMKDPFVNWILVEIPYEVREKIGEVEEFFSDEGNRSKFSIRSVAPFQQYPLNVHTRSGEGTMSTFGRTISIDDPVLEELTREENLIAGSGAQGIFWSETDIGLIVTPEFLKIAGKTEKDYFYDLSMSIDNRGHKPVPAPIRAIVRFLPGRSQFLSTPYFYEKRNLDTRQLFSPSRCDEVVIYCEDRETAQRVEQITLEHLGLIDSLSLRSPDVYLDVLDEDHQPRNAGSIVRISFFPAVQWEETDRIFAGIDTRLKSAGIAGVVHHIYKYPNTPSMERMRNQNRLSIHVSNLETVTELRDVVKQKFGIEIDLARVESLNNYQFVGKLTDTLSAVIIFVCSLTVCIFMGYILYIFLYKNRKHLGMLKAFGVPSVILRRIYLMRLGKSLATITLISGGLAIAVGYTHLLRETISVWFRVDREFAYFNMANWYMLVFVLSLVLFNYITLRFSADSILKMSPGDLIYDRTGENVGELDGPRNVSAPVSTPHVQRAGARREHPRTNG